MTDDRKEALDELEKELLNDDLLSDMPESLVNTDVWNWDEEKDFPVNAFSFDDGEELPATEFIDEHIQIDNEEVEVYPMQRKNRKQAAQQQEDNWQIILMAIASFLCLGIIGVMIYWLETFL